MNKTPYHVLALMPPILIVIQMMMGFLFALMIPNLEFAGEYYIVILILFLLLSVLQNLIVLTAIIVYAIHAYKHLPEDDRVLWVLLIIFISPIAIPVYWYKNILLKN